VRAMSWRAGLFLLIGIPVLLALAEALVGGLSFAMFSYPLAMLSIWQHGRRISRHAFETATSEATPDATQQQLVGVARSLDGGRTISPPTSDVRYISQSAYDAGLQAKRRRPTIIEGFALAAAALMIGSIGLSIVLPIAGKRKPVSQLSTPTSQPPTAEATAPPPTTKPPIQFSTRTEAAIALWNKSSPVSASNEFRVAMQTFENSTGAFLKASSTVDPDAVFQTATASPDLSTALKTYKQTSLDMLAAIRAYRDQMQAELQRSRLPQEQRKQITDKHMESYRLFDEWGSAAVQAADAGLTVRSLIERGLPSETAKQHFIETWNASYAIQQSFFERAQRHQSYTDGLLRK